MNLLLEDFLELAARTRNQSAHFGQLGADDVVQCCKEPVEVWRFVVRLEVPGNPGIIPAVA